MSDGVSRSGSSTPTPHSPETSNAPDEESVEAQVGSVKRNIERFGGGIGKLRSSRQKSTLPEQAKPDRQLHERKASKRGKVDPQLKPPLKPKPTKQDIEAFEKKKSSVPDQDQSKLATVETAQGQLERPGAKKSYRKQKLTAEQKARVLEKDKDRDYSVLSPTSPQFTPVVPLTPATTGEPVYTALKQEGLYANSGVNIYESLSLDPVYENVEVSLKKQTISMKAFQPVRDELPEHYQAFWPSNRPRREPPARPVPYHLHTKNSPLAGSRSSYFTTTPPPLPPPRSKPEEGIYETVQPNVKLQTEAVYETIQTTQSEPIYETINQTTQSEPIYETIKTWVESQPEPVTTAKTPSSDYQKLQDSLEKLSRNQLPELRLRLNNQLHKGGKKPRRLRKAEKSLHQLEASRRAIDNLANQLKKVNQNSQRKLTSSDVTNIRTAIKNLNEQLLPVIKVVYGNTATNQLLPVPSKPGRH